MTRRFGLFALVLAGLGCGDSAEEGQGGGSTEMTGTTAETGATTASVTASSTATGAPVDKAEACADTFGDALTDSYGRLDGTVLAVVGPTDTQCPLVNDDHLVIQVTMDGAVYRMVVNVDGVYYNEAPGSLVGPAWAEGWHTDVALEYPMLGVTSTQFISQPMAQLVETVSAHIDIGAPISVYAVSSGGDLASSAHLVHRNDSGSDGAILIDPTGADPLYLLFRFPQQAF
ncbi:MAG: hypothetical protein JNL21_11885 [Myxococcales bacterium]|nr:hypothetical protein [Myxococcales bacterium]